MFRAGAVVTILTSIVMVLPSISLVPALQAFTCREGVALAASA